LNPRYSILHGAFKTAARLKPSLPVIESGNMSVRKGRVYHSRQERLKNLELALTLMLRELGDRAFTKAPVRIGLRPFENIYPTTWQELVGRGLIV